MLPASKRDDLDEDHVAVFLLDLLPTLEWQAIADTYAEDRGQPPYDPRMMTVLLLSAYSQGLMSFRWIERRCRRIWRSCTSRGNERGTKLSNEENNLVTPTGTDEGTVPSLRLEALA